MSRRLTRLAFLGMAGLLAWPTAAKAERISASSTTIVQGRQDPRDGTVHTVVPFLELVSLRASEVSTPLLTDTAIVVSAWGEAVAYEPRDGKHLLGDVDTAYIEGSALKRHLHLRLGRQFVFAGTGAAAQLDGLNLQTHLAGGFGVSAFAGAPVKPRFDYARGNLVFGGRAFWRQGLEREIGASVFQLRDDGRIGRFFAGADARFRLLRSLVVAGLANFSIPDERWAELDAAVTWTPHHMVDVTADFRRTAPDLFLPRYSIFSVFAQQQRDELGGSFDLRPCRFVELVSDIHLTKTKDEEGTGSNAGAKAIFRLNNAGWTRFGVEGRRLDGASEGYLMGRVFARQRLTTTLTAVLDAQAYQLKRTVNGENEGINGHKQSYFASANAVYDYSPAWRVVLTGMYNANPYVKRGYEGLLKVVYNGGRTTVQEERP